MRRPKLRIPSIRRGRSAAGAAGALLVVVVAIIFIVSAGSPSQSKGASPSGGVSGATTVQYRDLVATDTESGTLSYANPQTVYNRESGTITWLPQVGAIVKPGGTLFDVDNAPVILFDGTTPAYRDLTSSDTDGPDIVELNRDLKNMGFDPDHEITVDNAWQTGTTDAVDRWQESLGATETGDITLGQIVFLPGRQEIDTLDTTVGSTGGSSASGASYEVGTAHAEFVSDTVTPDTGATGATGATGTTGTTGDAADVAARDAASSCNGLDVQSTDPATSSTQKSTNTSPSANDAAALPSCNQKGTTGSQGTTGATGSAGRRPSQEAVLLALLKAETLELKKSLSSSGTGGRTGTGGTGASTGTGGSFTGGGGGGGGSSASAGSGDSGSAGSGSSGSGSGGSTATAILQTSSTDVIVSVDLDATKQSEAKVGEKVSVEMPAGNTIAGKITLVSPIAQSSSSGSTGSGSSGSSGSGSSGSSGSGSSGSSATIPVTIALLDHHLPTTGLDQAAVSVNFQQQVEKHVLSVPVTALLATNGGGYAVQEAASPHKLIPVTPGLFAAGDVQISGSGIYPGLQVTDSQG